MSSTAVLLRMRVNSNLACAHTSEWWSIIGKYVVDNTYWSINGGVRYSERSAWSYSIEVMDCGTYLLIKGGVLINFTGVSLLSHIGWFEVWGRRGTNGSRAWIKMLSHHYYPHCLNIVNTIFEGDPAGSPIQNKHEGRGIPYPQKCMIKNQNTCT